MPKTLQVLKRFPGLIPSFLMAKISSVRKDIIRCGEKETIRLQKRNKYKTPAPLATNHEEQHYHILVEASKRASCHRWSTAEERNVGRNNYHWMNFSTMLLRLEILSLTQKNNIAKRALTFHKTNTKYYLCDWMSIMKSWVLPATSRC